MAINAHRLRSRSVLALLTSGLIIGAYSASAAAAVPAPATSLTLRNMATPGECLEDTHDSKRFGQVQQEAPCSGKPEQVWEIGKIPPAEWYHSQTQEYWIQSDSGECLDNRGSRKNRTSVRIDVTVVQKTCTGQLPGRKWTGAQQWTIEDPGNGSALTFVSFSGGALGLSPRHLGQKLDPVAQVFGLGLAAPQAEWTWTPVQLQP